MPEGESTLPDELLSLKGFSTRLKKVTIRSVLDQFQNLTPSKNASNLKIDWNYMLMCGSILANSSSGRCQDAAFRIAQHCLSSQDSTALQRAAAGVILDALTNSAAIQLATTRGLLKNDFEFDVPLPLRLEMVQRGVQNSILDPFSRSLQFLNKFQTTTYRAAQESDWLSISAPTSAGKSFILLRIVEDFFRKNSLGAAVYLVPTRALIQEVEFEASSNFASRGLQDIFVSSIPRLPEQWDKHANLYVFTQERLYWLLNEAPPDFKLGLLVVDEAQKIGDGARGILLQQAIEEVVRRYPLARVMFSSPMTKNPEILLERAPQEKSQKPVTSEQVSVNQNLLWASQIPGRPMQWTLELCLGTDSINLGEFSLPERPTHESKRLPFVAYALGAASGGNLIYVNGPAAAEKTALQLWELIGPKGRSSDEELAALIELTKKVVHQKYALATALERGVAFHYGNMPLLLKSEIEKLFKMGQIRFLVCTSTLIEGVNLPAKTIFIRGPQKGRGNPMGEIDFWNLAGRAGRQGKEFQGNVICVDPRDKKTWPRPPPQVRERYVMSRALDDVTDSQRKEFLAYVSEGTPRTTAITTPELEYAFTYFFSEHARHGSLLQSPAAEHYNVELLTTVDRQITSLRKKLRVPVTIAYQNPGISPVAQQELLEYFEAFKGDKQQLIPSLPEDLQAVANYARVIETISRYLSGDPPALAMYRSILVVNWMRGQSLSRMINSNWRYWESRGTRRLDQVIRDTMRDIEEFVRFSFAKYSSCYIDLLRYFLRTKRLSKLADQIPQISIWLEFGASQATQLSLMELGLSRTSAIAISEFISATDLDRTDVAEWLATTDLESLQLSPIVIEEVRRAIDPKIKEKG